MSKYAAFLIDPKIIIIFSCAKIIIMVQQNMWHLNALVTCTYKIITVHTSNVTAVSYTAAITDQQPVFIQVTTRI